ncbi:hypothetical protein CcaCcLH18_03062 [Colletotrichum camelliae]|nr:hypothetical protein CcaCcLH18_03062 [Colletotrichum camelliae]
MDDSGWAATMERSPIWGYYLANSVGTGKTNVALSSVIHDIGEDLRICSKGLFFPTIRKEATIDLDELDSYMALLDLNDPMEHVNAFRTGNHEKPEEMFNMARGPSEAKLVWDEAHDLKHVDSALHWPRLLRSMINKQVAPPAFLPVNGSLVNINLTDMRLAINLTRGLKGGSASASPEEDEEEHISKDREFALLSAEMEAMIDGEGGAEYEPADEEEAHQRFREELYLQRLSHTPHHSRDAGKITFNSVLCLPTSIDLEVRILEPLDVRKEKHRNYSFQRALRYSE